jgi:hypothetical protein
LLRREDRRDLGHLGLVLAIYGLALAPLLHAVYAHGAAWTPSATSQGWVHHRAAPRDAAHSHHEGVPHSHTPGGEHEPKSPPAHHHPVGGSVEHSQAVALVHPLWVHLTVFWVQVEQAALGSERPRLGRPARHTAMPQGP